jgi:hypothetical protein
MQGQGSGVAPPAEEMLTMAPHPDRTGPAAATETGL